MIRKRQLKGLRNLHAFFGIGANHGNPPRTVVDSVFRDDELIPAEKLEELEKQEEAPSAAMHQPSEA